MVVITFTVQKGTYLQIGPMTSNLECGMTSYYSTTKFYKKETSNLLRYLYKLNHTAESLEMTEEQCHRPNAGNKRKRNTGWVARHMVHLEIEECPG